MQKKDGLLKICRITGMQENLLHHLPEKGDKHGQTRNNPHMVFKQEMDLERRLSPSNKKARVPMKSGTASRAASMEESTQTGLTGTPTAWLGSATAAVTAQLHPSLARDRPGGIWLQRHLLSTGLVVPLLHHPHAQTAPAVKLSSTLITSGPWRVQLSSGTDAVLVLPFFSYVLWIFFAHIYL